jgi:hypothetical protein
VTLARLWTFLAVALPVLAALVAPLQTVDLAYQLRAGAEIRDAMAIPQTDTWTFTVAGVPWTDQQWGAQVILAAVYKVGGWTGLVVFRALLVAIVFGCLFEIARRRGLSPRVAACLSLVAFIVAAPALALRPQLLGMALFAVVLLLVADRRSHPRRVWAIPVIVLLWANVHGSFFLAPLVLGVAWIEDVRDRLPQRHGALIVAVVSAIAACLTPFGPEVWAYAAGLTTNPEVRQRITEWQPTSVLTLTGLLFYGSAVAVAVLAVIARRGRSLSWETLAWLAVFVVIGAYAERGVAWWPLGAIIPIAGLLGVPRTAAGPGRPEPQAMRRLNALVAALLVVVGIVLIPWWRSIDPGTGAPDGVLANAPSGVTTALREHARPNDRLLNPQVWGSWFEFALPNLPVAVDSRVELFPSEVWEAYDAVVRGDPGWEQQLAVWSVSLVVTEADNQAFRRRLVAVGWTEAFMDADGVLMTAPGR